MILLLLEKIKESGDESFIPYLKLWEKVDYKKVRDAIRNTINAIENKTPLNEQVVQERAESIKKALEGSAPQDLLLKCWECGKRFTFTVGEQQIYKQKGFKFPKRCKKCRNQRKDIFT